MLMPDSPTSEPESAFVCDCEDWMLAACECESFYAEHEGKRYCVLHFPGKEKSADFQRAFQRKLDNKDFNLCGVWFPDELSFSEFEFSAAADFDYAIFSADADFSYAAFGADANFTCAAFSADADFKFANFSADANFGAAFGADAHF